MSDDLSNEDIIKFSTNGGGVRVQILRFELELDDGGRN